MNKYHLIIKIGFFTTIFFLWNSCDDEIKFRINDNLLEFSKDTVYEINYDEKKINDMKTELSAVYGNYDGDQVRVLGRFLMERINIDVDVFKKDFQKVS